MTTHPPDSAIQTSSPRRRSFFFSYRTGREVEYVSQPDVERSRTAHARDGDVHLPQPRRLVVQRRNVGVYYTESLETAVAEVSFDCGRFMPETRQPPIDVDYLVSVAGIIWPMRDIRCGHSAAAQDLHNYAVSVAQTRKYRSMGSWGLPLPLGATRGR